MKKIALLLFLFLAANAIGQTEKRLALVVGNSEYMGKGNSLANPAHDATDVAAKLQTLDFDVTTLINGSKLQMKEAIHQFSIKARDYDVVLFYYSGHGLQSKGYNYMMPVDAELDSPTDIEYACYPLNQLLDKLDESNCPMKIIVLDACRNNPFTKGWYRGNDVEGLASVNPPRGTFITFATAAGSVALDGSGRNSPYTTAFLETLDTPNLSLFDFFNTVGQVVLEETHSKQDPWTNHSTMKGSFCFNMGTTYGAHVVKQETTTKDTQNKQQDEIPNEDNKADANELYENGLNLYNNKQYSEAEKWFRQSADLGHAEAQFKLGNMYYNGDGVNQNYSEAMKWFRKVADQDYAEAQYNLGIMYFDGYGCTTDYFEAKKWFQKAANQDYAKAQLNLGIIYFNGFGVTKDYPEAAKWFRKAADQGNEKAQSNLGLMYYLGYGVSKDYSEAARWIRKAADQGLSEAQYNLGTMYENGIGVPKDDSEALKWYIKAESQGYKAAKQKVADFDK